ncbi:MAG: hypothetical protein JWQ16_3475 [Novosphingobium sp.]|nr:hypothetical protein [Novosphingobium sp.]
MIWLYGLAAVWLAAPAWTIWLIVSGVRSGVLRLKHGDTCSRSEEPVRFWIFISIYAGLAAVMFYPLFVLIPLIRDM